MDARERMDPTLGLRVRVCRAWTLFAKGRFAVVLLVETKKERG